VQAHHPRSLQVPLMVSSAWRVADTVDTPSGPRYTVVHMVTKEELLVLHTLSGGWKFWNGTNLVEPTAGARAAVLEYERQ